MQPAQVPAFQEGFQFLAGLDKYCMHSTDLVAVFTAAAIENASGGNVMAFEQGNPAFHSYGNIPEGDLLCLSCQHITALNPERGEL